jgi:hypothetical protein
MKLLVIESDNDVELDPLDPNTLIDIPKDLSISIPNCFLMIQTKNSGVFDGKGFFLSPNYDWHFGKDPSGSMVLIPTIKECL